MRDSGPMGDKLGAGRGPETGPQLEDRAESRGSKQALGKVSPLRTQRQRLDGMGPLTPGERVPEWGPAPVWGPIR